MIKVFISQPMRDKTDEQIKAEREKAIEEVKRQFNTEDVEILDTFFEGAPHNAKPLWFLAKSLQFLSTADVAYFCEGWEKYRGCKIEHRCAADYNIKIID